MYYFEWLTWYTCYTRNLTIFILYMMCFKFYLIHVYRDVKDPVLTWVQTFFMLHKPPFRTLGALKSTSLQAFKIVLRLLTDALTPLFTWIRFFRYSPAIIDVLAAGFKVICMCYIGVLGILAYVPVLIFIQAPLKRDNHNLRVFYKVLQLCTI